MIIKEEKFCLKDGSEAVIRCPEEKDIPSVLDYLYKTAVETDFLLRSKEDVKKYTYEGEKELFERWRNSDKECGLVCVKGEEVIGICNISFGKNVKTRHRANIGIAILKDYWGLGIGSKMFEIMLKVAKDDGQILQCELDFIEGNVRARALYEKFGFKICGVHPNAIKSSDGKLLNEYLMIRTI